MKAVATSVLVSIAAVAICETAVHFGSNVEAAAIGMSIAAAWIGGVLGHAIGRGPGTPRQLPLDPHTHAQLEAIAQAELDTPHELEAENVCENGDHPAPDGERFCSPDCQLEDSEAPRTYELVPTDKPYDVPCTTPSNTEGPTPQEIAEWEAMTPEQREAFLAAEQATVEAIPVQADQSETGNAPQEAPMPASDNGLVNCGDCGGSGEIHPLNAAAPHICPGCKGAKQIPSVVA